MYVPNPILNDHFFSLSKPSYLKIKLQDDIIDFLKNQKFDQL